MSPLTRRELLLSLPALVVARRLIAQEVTLRTRGLHHVTLAVSDVGRSLEFYQRLFGMPVQARHGDKILLRIGNGPGFMALMPAGPEGPRIDHWGIAVEDYELGRVMEVLADKGVARAIGGQGLSGGAMRARISTRGGTPEVFIGDPDGLVAQLVDPRYCGGTGMLGETCGSVEASPSPGDLALTGISHLTINVTDPETSNAFYQRVFGFDIQAYQAASPILGVGQGSDFLMFIGSGNGGARVNHACFYMDGFDVPRVQGVLERHGIRPREGGSTPPMAHWVSMRMPNRGGAPEGTPELYFSDPDGLSIQLQDGTYCGGGGVLGSVC
ncbi:MAG: VOC family protein [Gemmatimonadota bacterium]|nr:VOC family protein [Gemmatimonadota bacterium]